MERQRHPNNDRCHDCGTLMPVDYMSLHDFGNHAIDYVCDKCLSKYPKTDPREWRREDHPDEFGVITWLDGSKSYRDEQGELQDVKADAHAEFELYEESGLKVAVASGPRADAQREINHYAMVYGQDGPVTIKERV